MIDKSEVFRLLHCEFNERLICHAFEFRPSILALDVKKLANISNEWGYIVIGASLSGDKYVVNGAPRGMSIRTVIEKSFKLLTVKPSYETCSMEVDGSNIYVIKIFRIIEGTSMLADRLNDTSILEFISRLCQICVKLQANAKYIDATEDERNDYIRDMLGQYDYTIKDQTRRGLSSSQMASGEVDIFVEKNKVPFTIIEALNLRSMNRGYLAQHLDKIYTYDTAGHLFNVCLVYAELKDFSAFFEKYCSFVKNYKFPYPTISVDDHVDYDCIGSEIKILVSTHNRSGQPTTLYHICVKILIK